MLSLSLIKTKMRMIKEAAGTLARTGITCMTIIAIIRGAQEPMPAEAPAGGPGACVVLWADRGGRQASLSAQGNSSPKCLGDAVCVGN